MGELWEWVVVVSVVLLGLGRLLRLLAGEAGCFRSGACAGCPGCGAGKEGGGR